MYYSDWIFKWMKKPKIIISAILILCMINIGNRGLNRKLSAYGRRKIYTYIHDHRASRTDLDLTRMWKKAWWDAGFEPKVLNPNYVRNDSRTSDFQRILSVLSQGGLDHLTST